MSAAVAAASLSSPSSSSPTTGHHNVFVYGSLMTDEVVALVLKRVPPSSPATLHGYHRFKVEGRLYPAIIPVEGNKVSGKVFRGITDEEVLFLDTFEDVEYERCTVEVTVDDSSEVLPAYTYVWVDKDDPDLYGEWDFEEWKKIHMEEFIRMTRLTADFVEGLQNPVPN